MSIRPVNKWTYLNVHRTFGYVYWSNGRMDMSNASITCKHISAWVPHLELIHDSYQ